MKLYRQQKQSGFTIIELLSAMTLFAFVLVMATVGFMQLNQLFHKAKIVTEVQEASRQVVDELANAIQFLPAGGVVKGTNETPTPASGAWTNPGYICIGDVIYIYRIDWPSDRQVSGGPRAALGSEPYDGTGTCESQDLEKHDIQYSLLESDFELKELIVTPIDTSTRRAYYISATVSFGDDSQNTFTNGKCRGTSHPGAQFCAISTLSKVVFRRL